MKITFHNFGIIREAEIDLKPLTIFIGPNNAGKTWTAYALASIFGPYGFINYFNAFIQRNTQDSYPRLDSAVEKLIKSGAVTIDFVQFVAECEDAYFRNVAHHIYNWTASFLGTELASFGDMNVSVDLSENKDKILERILGLSIQSFVGASEEKASLTIRKVSGDRNLIAYVSNVTAASDEKVEELSPAILRDVLTRTVLEALHRAVYSHVQILPTERTTFITHQPQILNMDTNNSLTTSRIIQEQKAMKVSGAVGHFLSMMQHLNNPSELRQREEAVNNIPEIKRYAQLAQLLEEQILGGKVTFSPEGILFQPSMDSKIELSIASSMVKELSPLMFYLRYIARPQELIIIDEPEMNLHPEAQAKIIEFLAMLVNANINVLITTHSPYITDHLSNLIKADESENKESIRNEFYLKRTDAFISKKDVSVYLFSQGKVTKALDEEGVIDLNTFGQVADRISEIYFTL